MALLGRRIMAERTRRNWSKADLARRAGLDPSYVTRIEAAQFDHPSIDKVRAIADALRIDLASLTDPPPPDAPADDVLLRRLLARKFRGNQRHAEIVTQAIEAASSEAQAESRTILSVAENLLRTLHASDD